VYCYSTYVAEFVALYFAVEGGTTCIRPLYYSTPKICCSVLQCVAVYCSMLQCVAVCCSVCYRVCCYSTCVAECVALCFAVEGETTSVIFYMTNILQCLLHCVVGFVAVCVAITHVLRSLLHSVSL